MVFWLMAAIAVLLFFSVHFLPETLPHEKRSAESLGAAFKSYGRLVRMKSFMMNTLSVTFFYVAVYAFITESPVIYIRHFGIDPQYYGLFFGVNIIGVAAVSYFNRMFVTRFSLLQLLKAATGIAALFSLWLLADGLTGMLGLWGIAPFPCSWYAVQMVLLPRAPMRRRSPKFRMRSRVLRRHSSAHSNTAAA